MQIIGHKGAAGLAPENTIESIKKALDFKVNKIEVDVRISQSGQPVLYHDPSPPSDATSLEEAILAVNRKCPLILDIKPGETPDKIIEIIKKFRKKGWQPTDIEVASFSFAILKLIKQQLPDTPIVVLEKWSGVRAGRRARRLKTTHVAMNQRWLWWGFIKAVHNSGTQLYAYTINKPSKAKRWHRYGLVGIVTDFPDRFV